MFHSPWGACGGFHDWEPHEVQWLDVKKHLFYIPREILLRKLADGALGNERVVAWSHGMCVTFVSGREVLQTGAVDIGIRSSPLVSVEPEENFPPERDIADVLGISVCDFRKKTERTDFGAYSSFPMKLSQDERLETIGRVLAYRDSQTDR